ncbi:MAG: hypothetical protein NTW60_03590 [Candidatus Wolfebacteria bacterium]|nr:hypothetical protein [Candidatus Wolfebacteria bacterium]
MSQLKSALTVKCMEEEILIKFEELNKKIDAVMKSVEKTRKYFLWTLIISVLVIILPLIGLAFLIPYYLNTLRLPAVFGL